MEYKIIKEFFKQYMFCYKSLLTKFEAMEADQIIWSNSYLEFYPNQYALNQIKGFKTYKNEPEVKEGLFVNKLRNSKLYYSYNYEKKEWGSVFLVKDNQKEYYLTYHNNDDDEIVLFNIYCIIAQNSVIEKIIFYSMDKDQDEETFMVDHYSYLQNGDIEFIERNGFYDNKKNILPTRTFRFQYESTKILIYSKQKRANNCDDDELFCLLNKSVPRKNIANKSSNK